MPGAIELFVRPKLQTATPKDHARSPSYENDGHTECSVRWQHFSASPSPAEFALPIFDEQVCTIIIIIKDGRTTPRPISPSAYPAGLMDPDCVSSNMPRYCTATSVSVR
ncbi:hypothetical protein CGRA01v4_08999 [Colletotrichum graminicola]|uniref:Uncharacterized protein n=1 Tax=Colletotrichum graminicola (strain M1.001 / M2 / FGSC 10212) TaxID=645133 RepID=E3Q7A4_COLGM|nr:uncharacterized protein GLRG_02562 [Colletotrichum graminicola M1.001]EFQ26742.1 hypothetical protein GLRG_02562 [Colletotrichum graminicola M1.001]WDK17716.1 hypothetical protein CGRA01v4_08999 [Colletotrichum graminicola]